MKLQKTRRYQLLSLFIALVFALTMYPTKAQAQIVGNLEADIPFQFHVGNAKLPAGKYTIHALDNSDLTVMEIVAIAAHRDTFLRRLGELKSGDLIRITVPGRQYIYSVRFTDVVRPDETWVLEPSTNQLLTLVTCYPFRYTGPAPKRFVVRARRMHGE